LQWFWRMSKHDFFAQQGRKNSGQKLRKMKKKCGTDWLIFRF
jgi:hypothetical protein